MKPIITSPHFWLAFLLWSLFLVGTSYWSGRNDATEKAELEANSRAVEAIQAVIDENAATLDRERTLRALDHVAHEEFARKQEVAKNETNKLIDRLRSGATRMRVPVTSCEGGAPASGQIAAGPGAEGRAELSPDAGEFLVNLLARGDEGIRKHSEVVDRYERLRLACAGNPPTTTESKP